jgi:GNAT superfamily N-acetyltransferase
MPLDYQLISKRDALALDARKYNPYGAEFGNLRLEQVGPLEDDDVVAVVALDGARIVGKILFRYGLLPFDHTSIRLACAQDLVVAPECRGRGIGRALLEHSTAIGVPQIHSGLSAMSEPLIEKLGFPSIDRSQAFQAPLSGKGLVRRLRTDLYASEGGGVVGRSGAAWRSVAEHIARAVRLRRQSRDWHVLPVDEALAQLDAVLGRRERRFQIPWNRAKLTQALLGKDTDCLAWVVAEGSGSAAHRHLVTAYNYRREIRMPLVSRVLPLSEWRVNEVYPRVSDSRAAECIIAVVAGRLAQRGADIAEVFAASPEMVQGCRALGLVPSICKSMYLVPSGVDADLSQSLTTPDQWWCRALNEEQYEESQAYPDIIVAPIAAANALP